MNPNLLAMYPTAGTPSLFEPSAANAGSSGDGADSENFDVCLGSEESDLALQRWRL
jgi:hypothetical protein